MCIRHNWAKKSNRNYNGSSDYRLCFSRCETTAYKIQTICIVHNATISVIYILGVSECVCAYVYVCVFLYSLIHFHLFFFSCVWSVFWLWITNLFHFCNDLVAEHGKLLSHPTSKTMTNVLLQTLCVRCSISFAKGFVVCKWKYCQALTKKSTLRKHCDQ